MLNIFHGHYASRINITLENVNMRSALSTTAAIPRDIVWVRYEWDLRMSQPELVAPTQYSFRSARTNEAEDIKHVVLTAYGSDPIWGSMIKDIERRMTERIATTLGRPCTDYIVAESEQQIVAVSGVAISHWTQQNFLTGLCVLPSHQRNGLGKQLLSLSLSRLRDMGLERATVYTELGSIADLKLYSNFNSVREEGVVYPALESTSEAALNPNSPAVSIKHNVYFDGKVQSLGFNVEGDYTTVGVITPGTYRFAAELEERVTVIKGNLTVKISEHWRDVCPGQGYLVPRGISFDVRTEEYVAYVCHYK
jgi:purine/pyrimidine-nucleoside phosphorylase